jgi:hypothetical protein
MGMKKKKSGLLVHAENSLIAVLVSVLVAPFVLGELICGLILNSCFTGNPLELILMMSLIFFVIIEVDYKITKNRSLIAPILVIVAVILFISALNSGIVTI